VSPVSQAITVAITGMNARADNPGPGLAVARCLRESAEFNGRIIGLGYDAFDPGLYLSQICDASYLLPYPSAGPAALCERLASIQTREGINLLIPCLDAELTGVVDQFAELTALGIETFLPDRQQLMLRNKDRLAELLQNIGLSSPRTCSITSPVFFGSCHEHGWHYPLVVKGALYDAHVVNNAAEACAAYDLIARQWGTPIIVQEWIGGQEINLAAVGDGKGRYAGPVMMRKQAMTNKGKAWAGVTVYDEALHAMADKLIAHTHWRGPLELEVMQGHDGRYRVIEINPRFPAWIYLSSVVGCNLPLSLLELACGEPLTTSPKVEAGAVFLRYAQELVVSMEDYQHMSLQGDR